MIEIKGSGQIFGAEKSTTGDTYDLRIPATVKASVPDNKSPIKEFTILTRAGDVPRAVSDRFRLGSKFHVTISVGE